MVEEVESDGETGRDGTVEKRWRVGRREGGWWSAGLMEMVEMMNDAEEQEGRMTGNGGGQCIVCYHQTGWKVAVW